MIASWIFYATVTLVGLLLGSFLNVVIYRAPVMWKLVDAPHRGDLAMPRSSCPTCGNAIRPLHLIPLAGFWLLGGKCADCAAPISARYPVVELAGAMACLSAALVFGFTPAALLAAIFMLFLIALAAIDHETGFLPDALTLPLLIIGLGANGWAVFVPFSHALIGAGAGYLIFRALGAAFLRLRGAEGLGQGDAKLLAALGAWLGWTALAPIVLLAALLALAGALIGSRKSGAAPVAADTAIPFGPTLSLAGIVMLIARGAGIAFGF